MRKASRPPPLARRALWHSDARPEERACGAGPRWRAGTSECLRPGMRPGRFVSVLQDLRSQIHSGAYFTQLFAAVKHLCWAGTSCSPRLEELLALKVDLEIEQLDHRAAQTRPLLQLHYQRALTLCGQFLVMGTICLVEPDVACLVRVDDAGAIGRHGLEGAVVAVRHYDILIVEMLRRRHTARPAVMPNGDTVGIQCFYRTRSGKGKRQPGGVDNGGNAVVLQRNDDFMRAGVREQRLRGISALGHQQGIAKFTRSGAGFAAGRYGANPPAFQEHDDGIHIVRSHRAYRALLKDDVPYDHP